MSMMSRCVSSWANECICGRTGGILSSDVQADPTSSVHGICVASCVKDIYI